MKPPRPPPLIYPKTLNPDFSAATPSTAPSAHLAHLSRARWALDSCLHPPPPCCHNLSSPPSCGGVFQGWPHPSPLMGVTARGMGGGDSLFSLVLLHEGKGDVPVQSVCREHEAGRGFETCGELQVRFEGKRGLGSTYVLSAVLSTQGKGARGTPYKTVPQGKLMYFILYHYYYYYHHYYYCYYCIIIMSVVVIVC